MLQATMGPGHRFLDSCVGCALSAVALLNTVTSLVACDSAGRGQTVAPRVPESTPRERCPELIGADPWEDRSTDAPDAMTLELASAGGVPNQGPLVHMTLKNTWTNRLWASRVMGDSDLELTVVDENGNKLMSETRGKPAPLTADDYVELAPGESITLLRGVFGYRMATGTRVTISAVYQDRSPAHPPTPLPVDFWFRGTISSNRIEVPVP